MAAIVPQNETATDFRNYTNSPRQEEVERLYTLQHRSQTVEFNREVREKYCKFTRARMGLWDMAQYLDNVVDESDPDTKLSQLAHAFQAAESLRKRFPGEKYDWLHLTGFIHDFGKFLAVDDTEKGIVSLPQWAVVGDTFPVGCAFDKSNIFLEKFAANLDSDDSRYNSKLGIYTDGCGFDNVMLSFGHDEYMYQVCVHNKCTLPPEALYIVRYHSFQPWHRKGGYSHLASDRDREMLKWLNEFSDSDLYSKAEDKPDYASLEIYYKGLIKKYFPEILEW
eukprot:825714_1